MTDSPSSRFLCAPGMRIDAQEKLSTLQFSQVALSQARLEATIERLERRLWLTVYGVVGVILAEAFQSILNAVP